MLEDKCVGLENTEIFEGSLPGSRIYYFPIPENPGESVLKNRINLVKMAGFNGILLPFYKEGTPLFESEVAHRNHFRKIRPDLEKAPDIFDIIFHEASENGLSVYAMVEPLVAGDNYLHLDENVPFFRRGHKLASMNRLKNLFPLGDNPGRMYLCINNVDTRRFVADLVVEISEAYPVSAVVLDIHDYPYESDVPDYTSCYCRYCRKQVEKELQLDLMTIPLDPEDPAYKRWKRWKEGRRLSFIQYVFSRMAKTRRRMPFLTIVPRDFTTVIASPDKNEITPASWASEGIVTSLIPDYKDVESSKMVKRLEADLENIPDDSLLAPFFHLKESQELSAFLEPLGQLPLWGYFISLEEQISETMALKLREYPFHKDEVDSMNDIHTSILSLLDYLLHCGKGHFAGEGFLMNLRNDLEEKDKISMDRMLEYLDDLRTVEQKLQSGDLDSVLMPEKALRHLKLVKKMLKAALLLSR